MMVFHTRANHESFKLILSTSITYNRFVPESLTGGSNEQFKDVFRSGVLYYLEVAKTANEVSICVPNRVKVEYAAIAITVKRFTSDNTFSAIVHCFLVFLE